MILDQLLSKGVVMAMGNKGLKLLTLVLVLAVWSSAEAIAQESRGQEGDRMQREPLFAGLDLAGMAPATLEEAVRRSYLRLAELITRSGEPIEFELGRFETVRRRQFGHTYWLAVVDFPSGRVIDVKPSTRALMKETSDGVLEVRKSVYTARWSDHPGGWDEEPWAKGIDRATVAEYLAALEASEPVVRRVVALTSFDVRVDFKGEQRLYRASMFWLKTPGSALPSAVPYDLIVQGLTLAVTDRDITILREVPVEPPAEWLFSKNSCVANSTVETMTVNGSGTDGHLWSNHRGSAGLSATCTCNTNCSQTCDAEITSPTCEDGGGVWDSCHAMAMNTLTIDGSTSDASTQGAACSAAFGCAKKSCPFCVCFDLAVTVSGGMGTLNVNFNGGPSWTASGALNTNCQACPSASNPPPPYGDPNNPGGGSGSTPPGSGGGAGSLRELFGGGGGGCTPPPTCDPDRDGWVTQNECLGGCGGSWGSTYCEVC